MKQEILTNRREKLEISAVVLTGFLKFILMDWLGLRLPYILAASLFWSVYVFRTYKFNPERLKYWGFQSAFLKSSFQALFPFALVFIFLITAYGLLIGAGFFNWHIVPILLLYPAWGIIQQFMMVGLVARNLKSLTGVQLTDSQVILFTSFLFALVHYPSLPLMGYAFILEVLFIWIYLKRPNLWSLGLYHGWISALFIFFVLKRDLWSELWKLFH